MPDFYQATCHPVSRRRFLGGSAVLLAGLAVLREPAWALTEDGKATVLRYATRRDDPWAIAHGVRAMGPGFTIQGGDRAVDYILSRYLQAQTVKGRGYLAFPLETEAHPNMFLKTFLEAGVPLDSAFTHGGKRRRLTDVAADAHALFRFDPATTNRNTIAWSLIALTRTTHPLKSRWTNAWGETIKLPDVVEAGFEAMEQASRPLQEAKDRGVLPEQLAPIHAYTCGGTHLLYSLLTAVQQGYVDRDHPARVRRQMDLLIWRLQADVALIERFYRANAKAHGVQWFERDAKLKFIGHAGECLAFARRHGLHRPTPAQRREQQEAEALVERLLGEVRQADLTKVAAINRELYRQLIGDTCHAYHGIHLA